LNSSFLLDSRQKHAGMTMIFYLPFMLTHKFC
ncbi:MAG: hypothetical protein ACI909_003977, partial [Planctomycetota bacterium]